MDANGDGCGDFAGLTPPARLPREPRRRRALADAVPAVAEPRRRLRHRRLLRRRPAVRHERRLRRVHARGGQPRHPRAHRPRRQPHLRPASVVPATRAATAAPPRTTGTSGRTSGRPTGRAASSSRACRRTTWTYAREGRQYYFHRFYDFQPDLNMANPRVREEVRRIIGLLAAARRRRLPHRRGAVRAREAAGDGGAPQTCFEYLQRVPRVPAVARRRRGPARRGERRAARRRSLLRATATGCT